MKVMKACLGASLLVATLLLSACASTQKTAYGETPQSKETIVQDAHYVVLVEQLAKQRGTRVVWVNPPKKRISVATAAAQ